MVLDVLEAGLAPQIEPQLKSSMIWVIFLASIFVIFFSTWIRYIHIFLFVAYKRPYSLCPFEDVFICVVIYLLWI
jgi:hypothetical protein